MTGQPTPREGFRWERPYCDASRLDASEDESGAGNAVAALRTHIIAFDGAKHGPQNEYPADHDTLDLAKHVVKVDDGR